MKDNTKAIPEISVDAQTLISRLRKMQKGEAVSYKELSALISADVQQKARGYLNTARNRLLMDEAMVFEAVRGIGIKRMDDAQIISVGDQTTGKIHRASKRALRKLNCSDAGNLTNDQKVELNTAASIAGCIALMTRPSKLNLIRAAVKQAENRLATGRTLDLFKL